MAQPTNAGLPSGQKDTDTRCDWRAPVPIYILLGDEASHPRETNQPPSPRNCAYAGRYWLDDRCSILSLARMLSSVIS